MVYIKKIFTLIPYLKLNRFNVIAIYSLLIILYNFSNLNNKIIFNKNLSFINFTSYLSAEFILAFCVLFVFLLLFFFNSILLKFFIIIFLIVSSCFLYFQLSYSIIIDELLIASIFETSTMEATGFITYGLIFCVIIFGILPSIYLVFYIKIISIKLNKSSLINHSKYFLFYILFLLLLLLISFLLLPKIYNSDRTIKTSLSSFMPMNYVAGLYLYETQLKADYSTKLIDISKIYPSVWRNKKKYLHNINVILVIGESARSDHQSLNGYNINTNPNLSKLTNLLSFPNVYSCGTNSMYSISCMLSQQSKENFVFPTKETNIISIFNSLNFHTSVISTNSLYDIKSRQGVKNNNLNLINLAFKDAKAKYYINSIRASLPSGEFPFDEYTIPFVINNTKKETNNFVILYLIGSHAPYEKRHPKSFAKFTCVDTNRCNTYYQDLISTYDNSILYTDYVLYKLIKNFDNNNPNNYTLIYYISDHAENLGENNLYNHGHKYDEQNNPYLIHIPQFIWVSKPLQKIMGEKYTNLVNKKHMKLNQDYVFHSLLHCIGVSSKIINPKLSLCN